MTIHRNLAVIATVALLTACASSTPSEDRGIARSKSNAVIVVGALNLSVDQTTVTVNARNGMTKNGQPIPSQVLWIADDSNATLGIEFTDPRQDCVVGTHCDGPACHAVTNVKSKGSRCAYKVVLNNTRGTDPVIIVDSCCP